MSRERSGRSSKIRTYDPHVPNVVLYQAELYSDGAGLIEAKAAARKGGWTVEHTDDQRDGAFLNFR